MEKRKITSEMYKELRRALPAEAVTKHPTKTYLSSIKAIYVVERLNEVFGAGMWTVKNSLIREESKHIVVKSELTLEEYTGYWEAFGGNDNADLGDAYKGACTDALTKIGSYLGIAMEVFKGQGNQEPKASKPEIVKEGVKSPETPKQPENTPARMQLSKEFSSLLSNSLITDDERKKAILKINVYTEADFIKMNEALRKRIAEREEIGKEVLELRAL